LQTFHKGKISHSQVHVHKKWPSNINHYAEELVIFKSWKLNSLKQNNKNKTDFKKRQFAIFESFTQKNPFTTG